MSVPKSSKAGVSPIIPVYVIPIYSVCTNQPPNFRLKLSALHIKRQDAQTAKKLPSMKPLDGAAA